MDLAEFDARNPGAQIEAGGRFPVQATLLGQLAGLAVIFTFVFTASLIVWAVIKAVMGVRVDEEDEFAGLDMAECGMEAYPEFVSTRAD